MNIVVVNAETEMEIFDGNAEEFLEAMEYDSELEFELNELDFKPIGTEIEFNYMSIKKTDSDLIED